MDKTKLTADYMCHLHTPIIHYIKILIINYYNKIINYKKINKLN